MYTKFILSNYSIQIPFKSNKWNFRKAKVGKCFRFCNGRRESIPLNDMDWKLPWRQWLTDIDAKAEGWVTNAHPNIRLSCSFTEWISSARKPGLLPPKVGHKLTIAKFDKKHVNAKYNTIWRLQIEAKHTSNWFC